MGLATTIITDHLPVVLAMALEKKPLNLIVKMKPNVVNNRCLAPKLKQSA